MAEQPNCKSANCWRFKELLSFPGLLRPASVPFSRYLSIRAHSCSHSVHNYYEVFWPYLTHCPIKPLTNIWETVITICDIYGLFFVVNVPPEMNVESSRSHLLVGIMVESKNLTNGSVCKGKLSLVDLAGSERAAKTGAKDHQLKVCLDVLFYL